jgi:hypothetical protein
MTEVLMRSIVMTLAMSVLGGTGVWAQPAEVKFQTTVGGVVGGGKTWDDEGGIGTGLVAGARAGRRLFGNTFAEISLERLEHERTGRFVANGSTVLLTGAILQRFGHRAAQPYVLSGITLARHSGTSGFPELSIESRTKGTNAGVVFGGGLAVRAGTRFEIGPEARFLILDPESGSAPAFGNWIGARMAVRF